MLLQFETLPIAGAQIDRARLRLSASGIQGGLVDLHAITQTWDESTVTYKTQPAFESSPAQRVLLRTDDPVRALLQSKENGTAATLVVTVVAENVRQPLDLSQVPIVIDEPGYYYLTRDWELGSNAGNPGTAITVEADDVTLDFQGHSVSFTHEGLGVRVLGDDFTLKNGTFRSRDFATVVQSEAFGTVVEHMKIYSDDGLRFSARATLRHSEVAGGFGSLFGSGATVEFNTLRCGSTCLRVGDGALVRGNDMLASDLVVLEVDGSGGIIADNIVDSGEGRLIEITGDRNQILDNMLRARRSMTVLVLVNGTLNVIDGNNAIALFDGGVNDTGISFGQDGNMYGGNRMTGTVPYALSSTVQTDWGGNVAY